MNKTSDWNYYRDRLEAERKAIEQSTSEQARAAHRTLAGLYADRLASRSTTR
jgi:hypothetical protein